MEGQRKMRLSDGCDNLGRLCEHPYLSRWRATKTIDGVPRRLYACLDPGCRDKVYLSLPELLSAYEPMPGKEERGWFSRLGLE